MALWTRLRFSAGIWLLPLMALLMLTGIQGTDESGEGYHAALTAFGVASVTYLAPLVALAGAYEGFRLGRTKIVTAPHARPTPRILWPYVLATAGPASLLMVIYTISSANPSGQDWLVIAGGVLTLFAWGTAGIGLGVLLPPALSLPLALIGVAWWMIIPRSMDPLWFRHLSGAWTGCCFTDQVLAPRALGAAALTNIGIATAGAFLIWAGAREREPGIRPFAGVALALTALVAFGLPAAGQIQTFGWSPTERRSDAPECQGTDPELCLWDDHRPISKRVTSTAAEMHQIWAAAGVKMPKRYDEKLTRPAAGAVPLIVSKAADHEALIRSLAYAVSTSAACEADKPDGSASGGEYSQVVYAWLLLRAGISAQEVANETGQSPYVQTALDALASAPRDGVDQVNAALTTPPC